MPTPTDRPARRTIARHGIDAELTNYEQTGEDDYGEVWSETADSPKTVKVIAGPRRLPEADRSAYEAGEASVEAVYLLPDTVTGIRDGGGEGASELTVDGQTFYVMDAVEQAGVIRLHCVRED